jgi:hypothetical protein
MRKLFKFDFSKMDNTPLKEDLQQSSRPDKDGVPKDKHKSTRESPGLPPEQLLYKDAFSVQSKVSAFVNPNGTRQVASATQRESYGDNTTQGSDPGDDGITIDTEEFNTAGAGVTNSRRGDGRRYNQLSPNDQNLQILAISRIFRSGEITGGGPGSV